MPVILMVAPAHLGAFPLATDRSVLEAVVDFSRLPYVGDEQEVNPDVAYVSEELLSQPFQDRGLYRKTGTHLHESLPDALIRGIRRGDGVAFLTVPNRWLVTRTRVTSVQQ